MAHFACLDMYHILILQFLIMHSKHGMVNADRNVASLYYMSNVAGVSIATLYRRVLELMSMGLVDRIDKGRYVITTKGALALALLYLNGVGVDADAFRMAINRLKEDWGLDEVSDDEVINYVSLLNRAAELLKLPLARLCARLGFTVRYLLPESLSNVSGKSLLNAIAENLGVPVDKVSSAERVIAKALLDFLPTITLKDGCKIAVLLQGDQTRKVSLVGVAMKCRMRGYKLGVDCPLGKLLLNKLLQAQLRTN